MVFDFQPVRMHCFSLAGLAGWLDEQCNLVFTVCAGNGWFAGLTVGLLV